MKHFANRAVAHALFALAVVCPAFGQEGGDLPKVKTLGCEDACAKWTIPRAKGSHVAVYPHAEELDWVESIVQIRLTVTADGHVKDPVVVKLVGPPAFARESLEAVRDWEYEPATRDGVPTERPNWCVILTYKYNGTPQGAREDVYEAFTKAKALLSESKLDDADALLVPVLSKSHLTFYERSLVSLVLSIGHGYKKEYALARDYAEDATLLGAMYLPKDLRDVAIRQRIAMEAAAGQLEDALQWFAYFKTLNPKLATDDHEVQLIDRIHKRLDSPEPLRVAGWIAPNGTLPTWRHTLLRRTFAIPSIIGKLTQLQLSCDQKVVISPITTTAEWHVPKNWSGCSLVVEGERGSTFHLVETNE